MQKMEAFMSKTENVLILELFLAIVLFYDKTLKQKKIAEKSK
jgi:hypothetical protein